MKTHLIMMVGALLLPACAPTPTAAPTIMPTVTVCALELILPTSLAIEPESISPGDHFKLAASGGYLRDTCGGYNESARSFDVYLDGTVIGQTSCYVNHCEGEFVLPLDVEIGTHCLSTHPTACDLEIEVVAK